MVRGVEERAEEQTRGCPNIATSVRKSQTYGRGPKPRIGDIAA